MWLNSGENKLMECMRRTAGIVRPANTELSPVFSNNTLLSVRCHIATASPFDKVWLYQVVPFFMASWMQVATDLSADQSLLCNLHYRFCCVAVVWVGKGTPTARKPLITLVENCLPAICYLPLVQSWLFQMQDCAANCEWLGKDPLCYRALPLLRMLHAYCIPACLFLDSLKKQLALHC